MSGPTVEVWRVEADNGLGPYDYQEDGKSIAARCGVECYNSERTPGPWEDGLGEAVRSGLHFGCPSRALAVTWFGEGPLRRLAARGFRLRRLLVPAHRVRRGDSGLQVAFPRGRAREVSP